MAASFKFSRRVVRSCYHAMAYSKDNQPVINGLGSVTLDSKSADIGSEARPAFRKRQSTLVQIAQQPISQELTNLVGRCCCRRECLHCRSCVLMTNRSTYDKFLIASGLDGAHSQAHRFVESKNPSTNWKSPRIQLHTHTRTP
eukprot:2776569-Amphidinium_carterae.2